MQTPPPPSDQQAGNSTPTALSAHPPQDSPTRLTTHSGPPLPENTFPQHVDANEDESENGDDGGPGDASQTAWDPGKPPESINRSQADTNQSSKPPFVEDSTSSDSWTPLIDGPAAVKNIPGSTTYHPISKILQCSSNPDTGLRILVQFRDNTYEWPPLSHLNDKARELFFSLRLPVQRLPKLRSRK